MSSYTLKRWLKEHPIRSSRGVDIQTPQIAVLKHPIFNSVDSTSCMVRFGRPFTQWLSRTVLHQKWDKSTWDVSISLILAPFQSCHRLHLLLMLRYQRNQHTPPNLFRKAHGCSSNPAGLQYPQATINSCPIHLLQLILNLCYVQYMIVVFACPVPGCMGNILLCHEG